jgi:hypothetical protein
MPPPLRCRRCAATTVLRYCRYHCLCHRRCTANANALLFRCHRHHRWLPPPPPSLLPPSLPLSPTALPLPPLRCAALPPPLPLPPPLRFHCPLPLLPPLLSPDFFVLALANWMVEYLMNQYYRSGSHHPPLGCWTLLALNFYCGIAQPFDERLTGSNASCPNRLVGLWIGSRLGSFIGSLIGCCNRVKWLTRTWFPATELRLTNAFEWLAERKFANGAKNFKRAGIAFNLFLFIVSNDAQ